MFSVRAILVIMNDFMSADSSLADGGANAGSKFFSARERLLQGASDSTAAPGQSSATVIAI
jgi:hypothetical protein